MPSVEEINPFGIAVLIKPDGAESVRPSGLIIPDTVNPGFVGKTGEVLKVGSDYNKLTGDDLHPGDKVAYMPIGYTEVYLDEGTFVLTTTIEHPRSIIAKIIP